MRMVYNFSLIKAIVAKRHPNVGRCWRCLRTYNSGISTRNIDKSDLGKHNINIVEDFISVSEEAALLEFLDPSLRRVRYQSMHIAIFYLINKHITVCLL